MATALRTTVFVLFEELLLAQIPSEFLSEEPKSAPASAED